MKYSIITPVFNREDCVARCLDSVVENLKWGIEIEHIVVDDGSHDSTANIVQKYAMQYPHIHFIKFDKNRGTNAARNAAIAIATGDYCIILDSDDYFVPDAMNIIDTIVKKKSYRHYLFLSDDTEAVHAKWEILKGKDEAEVTYEDMLLCRVNGDFIHVTETAIMRKFPFEESLRINEGVFFMLFHREEKIMLFERKIVTIRDRNRDDRVSKLTKRTDKNNIRRSLKALEIRIHFFEDDLMKSIEGRQRLHSIFVTMLDYEISLGRYDHAAEIIEKITTLGIGKIPKRLIYCYSLRCGKVYYYAACIYIFIKYKILKTKEL